MLSEITAFSNVTTPLSLEVELQASVCGEGGNTTPRHRLLHHLESKIKLEATNCRHCKYNARCWAVKLNSGASARAGKPYCCRNWKHIDARNSDYDVVYAARPFVHPLHVSRCQISHFLLAQTCIYHCKYCNEILVVIFPLCLC